MNQFLLDFYCNDGVDTQGRTIANIHKFNGDALEMVHDYIQWLFPTLTPSNFNAGGPLLDVETIIVLQGNANFKKNFKKSLERIFDFWGLHTRTENDKYIVMPISYLRPWMEEGDHNLLRMSRVMESCRLLGYQETASSLLTALMGLSQTGAGKFITTKNLCHWYAATFGQKPQIA
jgi:hypothetical protein